MVTPSFSADCANVKHDAHERYARCCVVAHWRHMPTRLRHELLRVAVEEGRVRGSRVRLWGGTVFAELSHHAAGSDEHDRFLGVKDLLRKFDEGVGGYGWTMALMEMLTDPVLYEWVPRGVVEQYLRWNPRFLTILEEHVKTAPVAEGVEDFETFCYRSSTIHFFPIG